MNVANDINSLVKARAVKRKLPTLVDQKAINSVRGSDSTGSWSFVSRETEELKVYQNNDDTSPNWVLEERDLVDTWQNTNGKVMRLPIPYD